MQITITAGEKVFLLTVDGDLDVESLKALCEAETDIPVAQMLLLLDGKTLGDHNKKLRDTDLKDGDMLLLHRRAGATASASRSGSGSALGGLQLPDFSQIAVPTPGTSSSSSSSRSGRGSSAGRGGASAGGSGEDDPAVIREMIRSNPDQLAMLRQNNVRLAEAYDSGSLEEFAKVLKEQYEARAERERQRMRMLTADPFDMEAQRLIAQEIENKNIDQNMELAMEYNPESFGTVIMLYIDVVVNGKHIKAFVDSGAQATIMSQSAAERCNIMRLVDRRWAGIAKGVGTQKIIGRVHMAQIQIGNTFLTSSFSILEEQPMDMLLGLDMLKRHQCTIDLKRNVLVLGSDGTETPFLSEAQLPECARLSGAASSSGGLESAIEQSAKEAEEKQLKEAMEKSALESKRRKGDDGGAAAVPAGSTSGASSSSTAASSAVSPSDKFTEQDVQGLLSQYKQFTREQVVDELRKQGGNQKMAIAALLAKSLKF